VKIQKQQPLYTQSEIVPRSLSSLFICKIEKQWKEKVKANEKRKGKRTKKDNVYNEASLPASQSRWREMSFFSASDDELTVQPQNAKPEDELIIAN